MGGVLGMAVALELHKCEELLGDGGLGGGLHLGYEALLGDGGLGWRTSSGL